YRVIQVAEDHCPGSLGMPWHAARVGAEPAQAPWHPLAIWIPVAACALLIVAVVSVLTTPFGAGEGPLLLLSQKAVAQQPVDEEIPAEQQVIIPNLAGADQRDAEKANRVGKENWPLAIDPAPEPVGPHPRGETFDTAVEFARNPRQAAKIAGKEDK